MLVQVYDWATDTWTASGEPLSGGDAPTWTVPYWPFPVSGSAVSGPVGGALIVSGGASGNGGDRHSGAGDYGAFGHTFALSTADGTRLRVSRSTACASHGLSILSAS